MTYLHYLHHLQSALHAALPLLITHYRKVSYPGSTTDIFKDQALTQLTEKVQALNTRIQTIRQSLADGTVRETDEAGTDLLADL